MASLDKTKLSSSVQSIRRVAGARRTKRIVAGVAIFLVLFGLLGFFAAPPLIRHIAEQQLSKQLDRPATIGRIALNPYTLNLEADRIHIGERGGQGDFIDIGRLVVRPSWSSLLRFAPIVERVEIDSPNFHIVRYDAQRFNFTDLVDKFSQPSPKPAGKPTPFSVSNIRVENGRIEFDDRLLGAKHVIDQWRLGIPFIATLSSKTNIFVEPLLRARIDGRPLAVDGKTKPFAASRESTVSLRFSDFDLPRLLSYSPTKLPVTVRAGKLSTDLDIDFAMAGDAPTLKVSGTTDLKGLDVADNRGAPLVAARAIHIAAGSLEPLKSKFGFDEIRIDGPSVQLSRDKAGVLNLQRAFASNAPAAATSAAASSAAAVAPAAPAASAASAGSTPSAASASAAAPGGASASSPAGAPPLDLSIKHFALNDGSVNFTDGTLAKPVALHLTKLAATLDNFSTLAKRGAPYTFNTALDGGGTLGANGSFDYAAHTADAKLALGALPLPPLQPYLDSATVARVADGALSANLALDANWGVSPPAVKVGAGQLDLKSLKLMLPGKSTPAVALAQGHVEIGQVDVAARTAQIGAVEATGLALDVERAKNGRIDLAELAQPPRGAPAPRTAKPAGSGASGKSGAAAQPWHYRIDELGLKDASATFVDHSTPRPARLVVNPLQLTVRQISDDLSRPLPVDLRATLNRKGSLDVNGNVTATPLKLALKVKANRLDAAAFEPYFGSALNATIASALLNADGQLELSQARALQASYRGNVALVDVRMLDKATSGPFAGWRSLALSRLRADYGPHGTDVNAALVTFSGFYGRVLLDAQGRLNLSNVVAKEPGAAQSLTQDKSGKEPVPLTPHAGEATVVAAGDAASGAVEASAVSTADGASAASPVSSASAASAPGAPTVTAARAPQNPVKLHFGKLVLQNGRVTYTDNFIRPNYTADLVAIHGTIGAFGTDSTTAAPVDVQAKLAANGPLSIRGSVNPLIAKPALDLSASAHDIELTNLTPYSAKYAGYPITKGKLNVDLNYKLENDQLTANNHLFIDQLTFGDHVDNNTATKLPVRLAISLLKNSRGEIDVNIPVSGSLANPQFSIGGLIWHAILNLVEKAVTAPFSLLANAFGGGGEELGYVEFPAGSAKLGDAADKKLDTIAKALADKPSIRIDLIGRVDPAVDEPALRTRYVERMVKQQKLKDVVGKGESVDTSQVTVNPDEYDKYLVKAYKAGDFKKPRNFIGMTKKQPDEDMKAALAAHAPVDAAALRQLAQQRAQAVQQYFEGKDKVESSRVFVVAPKLDAKGIKDKGATTRVDFGLK